MITTKLSPEQLAEIRQRFSGWHKPSGDDCAICVIRQLLVDREVLEAELAAADELHLTTVTAKIALEAELKEAREQRDRACERGLVDTKTLIEIHECGKCDLCEDHHD